MRFAPSGNLHRLGESTHVADVQSCVLCDAALDVRQELPLRRELLADGEGDIREGPQALVGLWSLISDRLLEEVQGAFGHPLTEGCRLRHAQSMVVVDSQHGLGAK